MSGYHEPVMLGEAVEILTGDGARGGLMVDATLGGGGHSEALLRRRDDVRVFGVDQDAAAVAAATARLRAFGARFTAVRGNFRAIEGLLAGQRAEGVLMDLGVSSFQLESAERGFSFLRDGPLDMRMDAGGGLTAADVVNGWREEDLARIFWELGEERRSRQIARAIAEERRLHPIRTTTELAGIVARASGSAGRGQRIHPATRVFQALRMTVNDELEALREGLDAAWRLLGEGGRLAVISFHSIEDREVKRRFLAWAREEKTGTLVMKKPLGPSREEARRNPRARSAKLRAIEKTAADRG